LYAIAIMHTDDLCELAQKELTRARALALARGWLSRLIELKLCQHDCDQDRLPQLLLHAQRDVHAIERSTHRRKPAEVKGRSLPFAKSTAVVGIRTDCRACVVIRRGRNGARAGKRACFRSTPHRSTVSACTAAPSASRSSSATHALYLSAAHPPSTIRTIASGGSSTEPTMSTDTRTAHDSADENQGDNCRKSKMQRMLVFRKHETVPDCLGDRHASDRQYNELCSVPDRYNERTVAAAPPAVKASLSVQAAPTSSDECGAVPFERTAACSSSASTKVIVSAVLPAPYCAVPLRCFALRSLPRMLYAPDKPQP
jgi:hypothetical protein